MCSRRVFFGRCFSAVAIPPIVGTVVDRFDMLEVNHACCRYGNPTLDQILFWDWDKTASDWRCQGWRLLKDCRDKNDPDKRRLHDARVDSFLKHLHWQAQAEARPQLAYRGEYVPGPWHPVHDWISGDYVIAVMHKGSDRRIVAKLFRESWTGNDPERENLKKFTGELRRDLLETTDDSSLDRVF